MKNYVKSVVTLTVICAIIAVLMAGVNSITAPLIKAAEDEAVKKALLEVLPNGDNFEMIDKEGLSLPSTIDEAYKESSGAYVFKLRTTGYKSDFIIMCGINADGTVGKALCISSQETLGYEKTYGENFKGLDADSVNSVDTVSNATLTTSAYKNAVSDAFTAFNILKEVSNNEE